MTSVANLELSMQPRLSLPPKCWNYRLVPPFSACLGTLKHLSQQIYCCCFHFTDKEAAIQKELANIIK